MARILQKKFCRTRRYAGFFSHGVLAR